MLGTKPELNLLSFLTTFCKSSHCALLLLKAEWALAAAEPSQSSSCSSMAQSTQGRKPRLASESRAIDRHLAGNSQTTMYYYSTILYYIQNRSIYDIKIMFKWAYEDTTSFKLMSDYVL